MTSREVAARLKSQSTARLFFLSLITAGIYAAHYIKRQTKIINGYLGKEQQISEGFANVILILGYVTVVLLVPYFLVEEGHPVEKMSDSLDKVWSILVLIWSFMARNRMNILLAVNKDQPQWFHGLWTLLFSVLYFNFKLNKLNEGFAEPGAPPSGGPVALSGGSGVAEGSPSVSGSLYPRAP